jgi:hypothetical protein
MADHHPNLNPETVTAYVQSIIIRTLVTDLLDAGWLIDVNDNDADRETHLSESADCDAIMAAIFNPELDSADYTLDLRRADRREAGVDGWVRLIDGNGASVISDYTTNLEAVLTRANKIADEIDTAGDETWVMARLAKMETALRNLTGAAEEAGWRSDYPVMVSAYAALTAEG